MFEWYRKFKQTMQYEAIKDMSIGLFSAVTVFIVLNIFEVLDEGGFTEPQITGMIAGTIIFYVVVVMLGQGQVKEIEKQEERESEYNVKSVKRNK